MGITANGRFAAVSNVREGRPSAAPAAAVSRGRLPTGFLQTGLPPEEYATRTQTAGDDYRGFSLLCGDLREIWWVSNRSRRSPRRVAPGVHGVSNAPAIDPGWPKVVGAREPFVAALRGRRRVARRGGSVFRSVVRHHLCSSKEAAPHRCRSGDRDVPVGPVRSDGRLRDAVVHGVADALRRVVRHGRAQFRPLAADRRNTIHDHIGDGVGTLTQAQICHGSDVLTWRLPQPVQHRRRRPRLLHAAQRFTGERLVVLGEAAVAGLP